MKRSFLLRDDLSDLLSEIQFGKRREHRVLVKENGEKIFVKFFYEKGIFGAFRNLLFPRGKREFEISERLRRKGISTPRCFGYVILPSGSLSLFEYLDGKTLYHEFLNSEDRLSYLGKLANFLKKLKQNGILHTDLHLENLILKDGEIILVDLHGVNEKERLSLKDEISNLAYALAMIYPKLTEEEKEFFFSSYGGNSLRERVEERLFEESRAWIERKRRRAFRTTSLVKRDGDWLHIRGHELKDEGKNWKVLKVDKKVEVLASSGVIKKIYRNSKRLKKAWENAVVLNYMKLDVIPKVYSVKLPRRLLHGFILMEDLSRDCVELDRFLDSEYETMEKEEKQKFLKALSEFLSKLITHGIIHRDLKACNLMVRRCFEFYLLDIEDIRFENGLKAITRMLLTLNTTVPKRISPKERLWVIFHLRGLSNPEKRWIAKRVCELSRGMEVVYEGKEGLKIERMD